MGNRRTSLALWVRRLWLGALAGAVTGAGLARAGDGPAVEILPLEFGIEAGQADQRLTAPEGRPPAAAAPGLLPPVVLSMGAPPMTPPAAGRRVATAAYSQAEQALPAPAPAPAPVPAAPSLPAPPPIATLPAGSPSLPPGSVTIGAGAGGPAGCAPAGAACAPCVACNPCGPNGPCGPDGRVWLSAELLLWWTRGQHLPPLVTASPAGTPRELAGVLLPGTLVLAGNENVNDDLRAGMRLRSGVWFDECQTCGLDGSFFFLGRDDDHRSFNCFDFPVLARPFFNAATGAPDSELVCLPGVITGSVTVDTSSRFWGADANLRKNLCCACDYRIDGLAGYRYLHLTDSVIVTENLSATSTTNPTVPVGTGFLVQDQFQSKNEFNGGQVGLAGEYRSGRWYVDARGLVALGNTHSEVTIGGATQISVPGGPTTVSPGGLLALPTNIGRYSSDQFSVVPEASLSLGYQLGGGIRAFVGYTFLYWSNVRRAGDQIDLVVNPTQIPPGTLVGAPRPAFLARNTDFWAQGISLGVEARY